MKTATTHAEAQRLIEQGVLPEVDAYMTSGRKAKIVEAVNGGLIESNVVIMIYKMTTEELDRWITRMEKHGERGLMFKHHNRLH